ncbi:MAG: heavy metal translocating P-type ATPase [Firmicutes bacterium]|nr:heavy metal translocating P-type ATPase [Bacillota bacterium]
MKQKFDVTGMSCAACSARVEKCVSKLDGVDSVAVNLLSNNMVVEYDDGELDDGKIIKAVIDAGYGADVHGGRDEGSSVKAGSAGGAQVSAAALEVQSMKNRLIASIIFFIPLFYISMGHMAGLPQPSFLMGVENAVTYGMAQLVLTLILMYINRKYYEVGFPALWHRAPNMDSLIAVGSFAAVIYGVFAIIRIGHGLALQDWDLAERYHMDMYFESAGTILTLITVGKYLEARSKGKTTDAVSHLLDLSPDTALAERNGQEIELRIEDVQVGDILIVKPGGKVPVDGVIVEGSSSVDESLITGESIPVDKSEGDSVIGASINKSGFFKMRAEKVGEDTALFRIIQLVEEAGGSKAPIARLADKISGVFVPIVMLIALVAAGVWILAGKSFEFALSTGIAVLVISCPCALGLATPAAIMAGTGRGAELGVLYKNAEILENARSVDTVVMDKTGTLTTGQPGVTAIRTADSLNDEQLLAAAASVEKLSEHPLAQAIVFYAQDKGINISEVSGFEAIHGKGVSAEVDGRRWIGGNARMMKEENINIESAEDFAVQAAEQGATPIYFACEGEFAGVIAVADMIRPESPAAVAEFKRMGIDVIMLTGDNFRTAASIAKRLGIENVVAEILPEDKDKEVQALMEQDRRVAMVGDGINDAPALARADVGIAIGAGTDVAIESADVVLMKSSPLDAAAAMQLSRAVIKNVKMNLFWAFIYNIIGIPIAAGLLYPIFGFKLNPMFGAAAMSLSSFCVVSNALRLRWFKPSAAGAVNFSEDSGINTNSEREFRVNSINISDSGSGSGGVSKDYINSFGSPNKTAGGEISKDNSVNSDKRNREDSINGSADPDKTAGRDSDINTLKSADAESEPDAVSEKNIADSLPEGVLDRKTERIIKINKKADDGELDKEENKMEKILNVEGMMCKNCVAHVEKALKGIDGVTDATADLDAKKATVVLATDVDDSVLVDAVAAEGYEASMAH